jgi:hypothetical protein
MDRRELLGTMALAVLADLPSPHAESVSALSAAESAARQGRGVQGRGQTQPAAQPAGPRPAVYPEIPTKTPASVREPFVGIYALVIYQPHGDTPIGRIQYDGGGRMWALLHPPSRPTLPQSPTLADYQATNRGLVAYYGTFDVDQATSRVIHHVQAGSNPAWFGTDFIRWYKFEGNRLILSLNAQFTSTLTWERLPDVAA